MESIEREFRKEAIRRALQGYPVDKIELIASVIVEPEIRDIIYEIASEEKDAKAKRR